MGLKDVRRRSGDKVQTKGLGAFVFQGAALRRAKVVCKTQSDARERYSRAGSDQDLRPQHFFFVEDPSPGLT